MNCEGVRRFKDKNCGLEQKDVRVKILANPKDVTKTSLNSGPCLLTLIQL